MTFAHTGRNQHGDIVATASRKTMVRKRPDAEAGRIRSPTRDRPGCSARADRPERFEKAAAAADVVILDLEGRRGGQGPRGRAQRPVASRPIRVAPWCASTRPPPPTTPRDLEAVARTPYTTGHVGPRPSRPIRSAPRPGRRRPGGDATGALAVTETARVDNAFAVMWARRTFAVPAVPPTATRTGRTARWPGTFIAEPAGRQGVRQAGAGLGVPGHQGPRRSARRGRRRRVGGIRRQRRPSTPARSRSSGTATHPARAGQWARHVLAAAREERGVFQFEGIMVDAPVLRRAERIVQLAPRPGRYLAPRQHGFALTASALSSPEVVAGRTCR